MEQVTHSVGFSHHGVDVRTERIVIPTYLPGPPDPNPPLFNRGIRKIYPYSWQKSFSEKQAEMSYDAVILKTRLIEATILPDWGFHLYRAVDLTSGRDLFFHPKVMKPAHNAIRGAYVAGGVELNFPIGHNSMTWNRVRLVLRRTSEGVQALFHDVDRCSGLSVTSGVTVTDNYRGLLFEQIFYNPTPLPKPWYCWLNAGLTPHRSLRLVFPTNVMLGHFEGPFLETKKSYPFPVRNGIDYSLNREIPEPIGMFNPGCEEGWFGAWYEDWDFGLARWAPPWRAAGQKFWSWGNSEEGLMWGHIAADQELPIPEIQSGRPETQMDRGILRPYETVSHREWWMALSGIGGLSGASRFGGLMVSEDKPGINICVSPSYKMEGCILYADGKVYRNGFDLTPGTPHKIHLPNSGIRSIRIASRADELIEWSDNRKPLPANAGTLFDRIRPVAEMSSEELFLKGFYYERNQRPDLAEDLYNRSLAKDPDFAETHLHLGLLALFSDDKDQALAEFQSALDRDRLNEEALYLHGLTSLWLGDINQAASDFNRSAATGKDYVIPSITQLAAISLRQPGTFDTRLLLKDGLDIDPYNPTLLLLQSVFNRKQGIRESNKYSFPLLLDRLGACLLVEWEKRWTEKKDDSVFFPAAAQTEDHLLIDAASRYTEWGCIEESLELLDCTSSPEGRSQANYLRRWIGRYRPASQSSEERRNKQGEPKYAGVKSYFFGWGRLMKKALQFSLDSQPRDSVAHFALACLLAEEGQIEQALPYIQKASKWDPQNSVVRTTLGCICLESGDVNSAVIELERAIDLKPNNPSAWVLLDRCYRINGRQDISWLERFSRSPEEIQNNEDARIALVSLFTETGLSAGETEYLDRASEYLKDMVFHPYELTHGLRNLWSRIHQIKALIGSETGDRDGILAAIERSLDYPPNLRLGRPLRRFDSKALFIAGRILQKGKDKEKALSYFKQAAEESQPDPSPAEPWSILAQIELGRKKEALARMEQLRQEAQKYLEAEFLPDLTEELSGIITLCNRIQSDWRPSLKELKEMV